jgi:DNA-directed RNA polymerase specialized sigma54-like protein
MSNVVKFPTKEELQKSTLFTELSDKEKSESLRDLSNILLGELIEALNNHGYWLEEERDTVSVSMVLDAVHSLLLRIEGIDHPFQGISEMMYDPENADAEMTVVLSEIED